MNDDFTRYQSLQTQMRQLIRDGKYDSAAFTADWLECEAIKSRNGGKIPEMPPDFDPDAFEQEQAETANEMGLR